MGPQFRRLPLGQQPAIQVAQLRFAITTGIRLPGPKRQPQGPEGRRLHRHGPPLQFGLQPSLQGARANDAALLHQHLEPLRIAEGPHRQGRTHQLHQMQELQLGAAHG